MTDELRAEIASSVDEGIVLWRKNMLSSAILESKQGRMTAERMRAHALPVRLRDDYHSDWHEHPELGFTTPAWVIPTISVLSGLSIGSILLALLCLAWWGRHAWIRRRRLRSNACLACGYALAGLPLCPECGHPGE